MSPISSFEIIKVVLFGKAKSKKCLSDPKIFLCIPASAADAAAVNPKGFGLITFFINGNPDLSSGAIYSLKV